MSSESIAGARGVHLPAPGRVAVASDQLALCVRPARWLVLAPAGSAGATAALWQATCARVGAAVDLSSGLAAWHLAGPRSARCLAGPAAWIWIRRSSRQAAPPPPSWRR